MTLPTCACGTSNLVAIKPGEDEEYGHPPDMFGMPDLRAAVVIQKPGIPTLGWCLACWPFLRGEEAMA